MLVIMIAGSVGVWTVERRADGPIETYDEALWWSITTVTTVGYGDMFPVTPEGRGIAALLMFAGIAVFGIVTANLARFLIREPERADTERLEAQVAELTALVTALRHEPQTSAGDDSIPSD